MTRIITSDKELLSAFVRYRRLSVLQLEFLNGRNERSLQRRLKNLLDAQLLARKTPPLENERPINAPLGGYVFFLTQRGFSKCRKLGLVNGETHCEPPESSQNIPHDSEVTWFHIHLDRALEGTEWELTEWLEGKRRLLDHVSVHGERLSVNSDGLFCLSSKTGEAHWFFLEVERMRGAAMKKFPAHFAYRSQEVYRKKWADRGMEDYRVIFVLPNEERRINLLGKARDEGYPFKMFWVTTGAEFRRDMLGEIFRTPRDFSEGRTYSFLPRAA